MVTIKNVNGLRQYNINGRVCYKTSIYFITFKPNNPNNSHKNLKEHHSTFTLSFAQITLSEKRKRKRSKFSLNQFSETKNDIQNAQFKKSLLHSHTYARHFSR